jgi:hypothetical protein
MLKKRKTAIKCHLVKFRRSCTCCPAPLRDPPASPPNGGEAAQGYVWLQDLLHEIGFALLVAVFIWIIFDYFSHADQETRWRAPPREMIASFFVHDPTLAGP